MEREENGFSECRPLNNRLFSPNGREEEGDKGEPLGEMNRGLKKEK